MGCQAGQCFEEPHTWLGFAEVSSRGCAEFCGSLPEFCGLCAGVLRTLCRSSHSSADFVPEFCGLCARAPRTLRWSSADFVPELSQLCRLCSGVLLWSSVDFVPEFCGLCAGAPWTLCRSSAEFCEQEVGSLNEGSGGKMTVLPGSQGC